MTCGATSGPSATLNLMQLFQQQYRITGSFGSPISALSRALDRIATGVTPVIDTIYSLDDFRAGVARLEHRDVFGKILVELLTPKMKRWLLRPWLDRRRHCARAVRLDAPPGTPASAGRMRRRRSDDRPGFAGASFDAMHRQQRADCAGDGGTRRVALVWPEAAHRADAITMPPTIPSVRRSSQRFIFGIKVPRGFFRTRRDAPAAPPRRGNRPANRSCRSPASHRSRCDRARGRALKSASRTSLVIRYCC